MSRQPLIRVCDLLLEPTFVLSGDGTVVAANRSVEARLGLPVNTLLGKKLADHLEQHRATELHDYLAACSRSQELVPGPVVLVRKGEDTIPCFCEGGRLSASEDAETLILLRLQTQSVSGDEGDAILDRLHELSLDLDRRRLAEQSLAEQKQWLEVTLASIGDAVIITDSQGRVSFLNPVAESLTGWRLVEAAGRPLEDVFSIVNEYTRATVENPVSRVLRDGTVVGLANHTILIARDGTERPIDDCAAPIENREGDLGGVVLVCRDVTQRNRADKRLAAQHAVTRILAESPTLQGAASKILEAICHSLQWEFGGLWGIELQTQTLHCVQTWRAPGAPVEAFDAMTRQLALARGVGLPGQAWATGGPVWISDITRDPLLPRAAIAAQTGLHAAICFPVRLDAEILGVIEIFSRKVQEPDEDLLAMMGSIGGQVGQFIERRRAETALRESQARFQAFMDANPSLAWIKDEGLRHVYVNKRWTDFFQHCEADWQGHTDFDLWPQIAARLRENDRAVLDTQKAIELLEDVPDPSGSIHHWLVHKFPMHDAQGRRFVGGVATDITERRHSESLLEVQSEVLQAIAIDASLPEVLDLLVRTVKKQTEGMEYAVLLWDEAQKKLHLGATSSLPDQYGRDVEGLAMEDAFSLCGAAIQQGQPVIVADTATDPLWTRHRDFASRHGLRACWSVAMLSLEGKVLGVLVAYCGEPRNPSDFHLRLLHASAHLAAIAIQRHRARQALLWTQQQLANTEKFSLIMAAQLGLDGTWLKVPPRLCEVLGYTEEELLARKFQDVTHPEDVADNWETCQRLFRGDVNSVEYEKRYVRKDGSIISVYLNSSMIFDREGKPDRMLTYIRDITEQKRLEEHLRQSQKMEAVGRLAGGVAHDFNNMLTIINGYCDLTLDGLQPFDPIHENIVEIRKAAERSALLTHQLLAFSRKQILAPKALNLNEVVTESEKMLHRLIGEDVEIKIVLDPKLGAVMADSSQVEQLIMNLAINARDAMPQGGLLTLETSNVDLDVQYALDAPDRTPGRYVMLAISDTGLGMDAETKAHVFEPFFTTKEPGRGTGLGLATVYSIVQQSGGHIAITSEPGAGSTFKVFLPRVETAERLPAEKNLSAPGCGTETILLVEDEDMVRTLACRILRSCGYDVLEACNGGEGLLMCEQHRGPIHLVLTDVVMPRMSGRELAQRLRLLRPDLKVIFMSGYTDDVVLRHGILSLDAEFIQKPFSSRDLVAKVRAVLDA